MEIANASVLITGAAQRIGAVLVRRFAAAGARVIIHCNQSLDSAKRLLEEIGGENAGHSVLCCDLAKPENIPAMFNDVPRDVSILINNASTFNRQGILNEPLTMDAGGTDAQLLPAFDSSGAFGGQSAGSGNRQNGGGLLQLLAFQESSGGSNPVRRSAIRSAHAGQRTRTGTGFSTART